MTTGVEGAGNDDAPLPNAGSAIIDPRKALDYALDPSHPTGRNKARVFEAVLGFNRTNADDLLRQLGQGVARIAARLGRVDAFGSRYTVDVPVIGPKAAGVVRTGWIVRPGSDVPVLVTMFVT